MICPKEVLLKKLNIRFELEAKSPLLDKLLFAKIKRSKSSQKIADTKHLFLIWWLFKSFNNVLSIFLPLQWLLITLSLSWQNFASHSFRAFKTITVTLWSDIFWRWRRTGTNRCNHWITYNIYSILTDHINIAIDTFTLYSTTSNRLTGSISTLNILPGIVEWTNFDNMYTCEIDGEVTEFLHDGVLLDGNI